MTSHPELITAFITGILAPISLFGIWMAVAAVRRGTKIDFGGGS